MADKYRYFAGLVYPDSAPDDWRERLKATHGCYAISPMHEPDGDAGKPHYHVIYRHSNTCSLDVAMRSQPAGVFANDYMEPVRAPRNYQRYLIHLDDPEKQQFAGGASEITVLNGFPLDLSRDYSHSELLGFRADILALIRECNLLEYADLLDYLSDAGMVDLLDYASNHTLLFNTYITSRREKARWDADE